MDWSGVVLKPPFERSVFRTPTETSAVESNSRSGERGRGRAAVPPLNATGQPWGRSVAPPDQIPPPFQHLAQRLASIYRASSDNRRATPSG